MTKVLWHLEVISWHCCSVMRVVMKLKLFHIFGVVASWLDKPRRVCSHSLCAPLSLSARLRFVVNADNGNVDCRHGLCASVVCTVSKNDWDYDDEHLCCCEKLLKLCVTARTGHFHSHLGEQDLAGRRRVGWCHELSGAELSPGFQCVTLTFGCVCRDVLAAYSCQGTNVPVCKLIQTPPHLSGASQRAEVPEGFRCTRYWVFLVLCGFRGVLHLLQAQQGWYKAVTLLSLQEGHFRGCWEQYWSTSVSLTCLVHVTRF